MIVTIKPLLFVSLLAWFLEATIATNLKSADNRKYLTTATCAYLTNDGKQYNAYTYPEFGNKFCCMCRRGTKLDGDCDPTDATTTKCIPCPTGTYQDFEPHDQVECVRKNPRYCPSSKVYLEESRTEDDGRCVCPDGMIDDARSKNCVPDAFSKSKEIAPKRSSTTTRPTLPTIISTHKTDETSASRLPGNNKGDDSSQSSKPNNSSGERQTVMVDGSDNDGWIIALSVVLFVLVPAAVIAGVYKLYHKLKRRKPQPAVPPSTYTSVPVEVEGQQQQPAQEDSIRMRSECRLDCKSDEGRQLMDASHDEIRDNRRSQLNLAGAANPENSNMLRGNESLCSKAPDLIGKPDVPTEGVDQDVKSLRTSNHAGLPMSTIKLNEDHTGSIEMPGMENAALAKNMRQSPVSSRRDEQIIISEEKETLLKAQPIGFEYQDPNYTNTNRLNDTMNNTDDILPTHRFHEFATKVGVELGEVCAQNDILPLFRNIVGHKYSHRLDDISAKCTDRRELFYQCMQFAITHKGASLSPLFILNEVRNYGMTRYTEIVVGVLGFLGRPVDVPVSEIT